MRSLSNKFIVFIADMLYLFRIETIFLQDQSSKFIPRATTREADTGSVDAPGFFVEKISENLRTKRSMEEFAIATNWSSGLFPPEQYTQ